MSWRFAGELLMAAAVCAFAFVPWSLVAKGVRELWLTWNGKSRNRSVSGDR